MRASSDPVKHLFRLLFTVLFYWTAPGEAFQLPAASKRSHWSFRRNVLSTELEAIPLGVLDAFWKANPYTAAALTCGFKASAADYVAQKRQDSPDQPKKRDLRRNLAFTLYGALYQGTAQEFIYNHLYPLWFGAGSSPIEVASKVVADLFVQTTLITLPTAYLTKAAIYGYSFKEGLRRYANDIKRQGLLKKYFALWGPVQCITFSVVPEHWRVTFIACVSFFWLIILSTIASKPQNIAAVEEESKEEIEDCVLVDSATCLDG